MIGQDIPQKPRLFPLADTVGGDKGGPNFCPSHKPGGFPIPCSDIIHISGCFGTGEYLPHILFLFPVHETGADKRRIADDIQVFFVWNHRLPIDGEGVALDNDGRLDQRDPGVIHAEKISGFQIHLMICQPQADPRDLSLERLVFDSIKLTDLNPAIISDVQHPLRGIVEFPNHRQLQFSNLPVRENQKIPAAAGRVEKFQPGQLLMEFLHPLPMSPAGLPFLPELVQEQWADQLFNIFLRGVIGSPLPPFFLVHNLLKHCAENRRRNPSPVHRAAAIEKHIKLRVKWQDRKRSGEQMPIHIGECKHFLRQSLPLLSRCIQGQKKSCQALRKIGPVRLRRFHIHIKLPFGKNPGIAGKQAKQQPHQIDFQVVLPISVKRKPFQQSRHLSHRSQIDVHFFRFRMFHPNFLSAARFSPAASPFIVTNPRKNVKRRPPQG